MIKRIITFLIFFCNLLFIDAKENIRVAELGYDSCTNELYVVLDNLTPYVFSIYPYHLDIMQTVLLNDNTFSNATYFTCRVRDDKGRVLNKESETKHGWFLLRSGGALIPPFKEGVDIKFRTLVCHMGKLISEQAHSLEIELHVKLFRINVPEIREIPFYEKVVHKTIELFAR